MTTWVNNTTPAINAENLNKIEKGIANGNSAMVLNTNMTELSTSGINGYVVNKGSTIDVTNITYNSNYQYYIVNCTAGDKFVINSHSNVNGRSYSFSDASNNILEKAISTDVFTNGIITAPTGATLLVINQLKTDGACYSGEPLISYVRNSDSALQSQITASNKDNAQNFGVVNHLVESEDNIGMTANWNINKGVVYPSAVVPPYDYCLFKTKKLGFKVDFVGYNTWGLSVGVSDGSGFITTSLKTGTNEVTKYSPEGTSASYSKATITSRSVITNLASHNLFAYIDGQKLVVKELDTTLLVLTFDNDVSIEGIGFLSYSFNSSYPLRDVQSNPVELLQPEIDEANYNVNAIAKITKPDVMDSSEITWLSNKYWGNGGLVDISSSGSRTFYAAKDLITVLPNQIVELYNFGYATASQAVIGMYNNDGNDAPGRVNLNSEYVLDYDLAGNNLDYVKIITSPNCTQIGLEINSADGTSPDLWGTLAVFVNGEPKVAFTNESKRDITDIIYDVLENTEIDTASIVSEYYLKGSAQKLGRTKKLCIIGAGQSNIDGRNDIDDLPSYTTNSISGMKYCKNKLNEDFSSSFTVSSTWGFDFITNYFLRQNLGADELYYIKWSMGGTSIDPTGAGSEHWTADYEELGDLDDALLLKFNKEIENLKRLNPNDYEIGAMIWHQGESDSSGHSALAANNYYNNFKKVIAFCRGISGNECLPFVCGSLALASAQYDSTVDAAIRKIAAEDPYVWMVDLANAQLQDAYHFDADWSEYFGKKVYDCLIDAGVITGEKLNPSEPTNE